MQDYANVINAIKADELIKFTQDIVRINSVFDPNKEGANESRVVAFISDFLIKKASRFTWRKWFPADLTSLPF